MSKSTGSRTANGRGNSAIVDVVQRRQSARLAKITFLVSWLCTGAAVAVVASAIVAPVLAVLGGVAAGFAVGAVTALVVAIWPVLRVLWWWAVEITGGVLLLGAYLALTQVAPWWAALALLVFAVGGPWLLPRARRWLLGWTWCIISRHRLRSCFALFIRANRYGSLPLMLWVRPTPAGERLWVWLRPGLSLDDLTSEGGLSRLAVGCWASEVRIARASKRAAGLLRVDLTRRNPLSGVVSFPLAHTVPTVSDNGHETGDSTPVDLSQLDLPGVPPPRDPDPGEQTGHTGNGGQPASRRKRGKHPATSSASGARTAPAHATADDDINDWI